MELQNTDTPLITADHLLKHRSDKSPFMQQVDHLSTVKLLEQIMDALPESVVITTQDRLIVFANKAFIDFLGEKDRSAVYGLRFGEIVQCENSLLKEDGCGAAEACLVCGARQAQMSATDLNVDVQECRISATGKLSALELKVMASPFEVEGKSYIIMGITDISDQKRRHMLERIFFHDLLNTAGGLRGFAELMKEATREELDSYKDIIYEISERLIEEINSQRDLLAAENGELVTEFFPIDSLDVLLELQELYQNHDKAKDRFVVVDDTAEGKTFDTDKVLLKRVLGNMIKNALEATKAKETVTLSCTVEGDWVVYTVQNPGIIPEKVQLEIFKRSYSTKGSGRGLGTYSMKLLSEQYLGGEVDFISSAEKGTTFIARYKMVDIS